MSTGDYLRRLGIDEALPPTLDSLRLVHTRHQERVPYENLGIMLGPAPSVDPAACLERIGEVGRAGYCLHQNGALELVLRDLGFDVERRHGHVWTDPAHRDDPDLNHLVVVVSGLATQDNPGGRWWPDVGLGEAFRDPLPLMSGEYADGPFCYRIDEVRADGWSFTQDPSGSFTGLEVTSRPTDPVAVLAAHAVLSTQPHGHFARLLVVQRRDAKGLETVRGCVATRIDAAGRHETDLTVYDDWRAALVATGLSLEGVSEVDLHGLFDRSLAAHKAWVASGRP
ncbi:MAG: arylamine N-acetyltransferase [Nocardioides sp.]